MTKQSEAVAHPELVGGGQTSLHSHAGGGGGLVTEYSESEGDSTTTSTGWQTKLTHTVQTAGTYFVQWYYEYYGSSATYHARAQVLHNSAEIANIQSEPKDVAPAPWAGGGGIKQLNLAQGDTIKINYCSENAGGTTHCRFARIALVKVG
jgi:hypothetical protein